MPTNSYTGPRLFQMNASKIYLIVKPVIIVGICGQTGLGRSFTEHAFGPNDWIKFVQSKLGSSLKMSV